MNFVLFKVLKHIIVKNIRIILIKLTDNRIKQTFQKYMQIMLKDRPICKLSNHKFLTYFSINFLISHLRIVCILILKEGFLLSLITTKHLIPIDTEGVKGAVIREAYSVSVPLFQSTSSSFDFGNYNFETEVAKQRVFGSCRSHVRLIFK